ncbi:MAG: hypothetical protein QM820_15860 [Minicystis sp.]
MAGESRAHRWRFFRVGGFDQVQLDTGADLIALEQLDQKLWVALSCPVDGLEFDQKTLEAIDADKDGRIRALDVLAAVKWAGAVLKSPDTLVAKKASVPLSAIDAEDEEGRRLLASAKQILKNLGKKGAKEISLEDTTDTAKIFAQTKFNGDGVIPITSADDEDVQHAIRDIVDCVGSEVDRSGAPGVSQALIDKFFTEAEAFSAWWRAAESDAERVLPLGDATPAAAEALRAVRAKVDDYFARARLVAFDARAAGPLNRDVAEYAALAAKELSKAAPEVASFPLAQIEAGKPLPLDAGINPAWTDAIHELRAEVVTPLLGEKAALTDAEWTALAGKLDAFEAWRAAKAGASVEKLGLSRVRALLDSGVKAKIEELIAKDKALEPEANAIASVDKLIRYCRDLHTLCDNFVSFRDFYSGKKKAIFQAGTLYLDGRSCDLCLKVRDVNAHANVATLSGTYLAYCDCTRKGSEEKMSIVAAFTDGDADALMVGRNGVFYDRKGHDWDATIVKLIEHPISVRQAFWTPYRMVAKLVRDQLTKVAAAREKEAQDKAAASVAQNAKLPEVPRAAPAPAAPTPVPAPVPVPAAQTGFDIARFSGIFAAIGLALGTVLSGIGMIFASFLSLRWWQMPLVIAGIMLVISGPFMLIAWFKLRERNIGPILDGNGWAVNARAKMNITFGASLTAVAQLPPNAVQSLDDPFADGKTPWGRYAMAAVLAVCVVVVWNSDHLSHRLRAWLDVLKAPVVAPGAVPSASAAPSAGPK